MADTSTPQSHQYLPSCRPTKHLKQGIILVSESDFLAALVDSFKNKLIVPHFSHARIRFIEFRKETGHVQHEYLLVYLTADGRPWEDAPLGILKCERHIDDLDDRHWSHIKSFVAHLKLKDHSVYTAPQAEAGSTAAASVGFKGGLKADAYIPAADRFIYYTPQETAYLAAPENYILYKHEYDTPPLITGELNPNVAASQAQDEPPPWNRTSNVSPTLYHLAAVTTVFNERWPEYILMHRQCYWYAAVVYHALGGQDERAETSAVNNAIEDAFRPEEERNLSPVASANAAARTRRTLFFMQPGPAGSFYSLFKLVTRSKVEDLYHEENLAAAIETQVTAIYGALRAKVANIREEKTNEELLEQLMKERVEVAKEREATHKTFEAERAATAKEREAERAAAAEKLEAVMAMAAEKLAAAEKKLEEERAATANEREAERAQLEADRIALVEAAVKEREAERAAARAEFEAAMATAEKNAANELAAKGAQAEAQRAAADLEREEAARGTGGGASSRSGAFCRG